MDDFLKKNFPPPFDLRENQVAYTKFLRVKPYLLAIVAVAGSTVALFDDSVAQTDMMDSLLKFVEGRLPSFFFRHEQLENICDGCGNHYLISLALFIVLGLVHSAIFLGIVIRSGGFASDGIKIGIRHFWGGLLYECFFLAVLYVFFLMGFDPHDAEYIGMKRFLLPPVFVFLALGSALLVPGLFVIPMALINKLIHQRGVLQDERQR